MEFTIEPVPSRSLIRRTAPWTMALGLFAGGGYGVYHYAAPVIASEFGKSETGLDRTEVDRLFGDASTKATAKGYASTGASPEPSDGRYGASQYPSATFTQAKYTTPSYDTAARDAATYSGATTAAYGGTPAAPAAEARPVIVDPTVTPTSGNEDDRYGAALAPPPAAIEEPRSMKLGTITPSDSRKSAADVTSESATTPTPSPFSSAAPAPLQTERNDERTAASETNDKKAPTDANPLRRRLSDTAGASPERLASSDLFAAHRPTGAANENAEDSDESSARAAFDAGAASARPLAQASARRSIPPAQAFGDQAQFDAPEGAADAAAVTSAAQIQNYYDAVRPQVDAIAAKQAAQPPRQPAPAVAIPLEALAGAPASSPTYPPTAVASASRSFADDVAAERTPSYASVTPTPGLSTAQGAGRPGERTLEGTQTPSLKLEKLAPTEVQVGKKCTFAVRVTNNGARAAHNVQIRDETPLGMQLVGTAPKGAVSGSQIVWDLGTLSPGEERTVEMELLPVDEGELGSVATVSFTAEASAKARSTRPQLALRLSSTPRVMAGEMQIVEVELSNPGSGPATGVMLFETLPEGVSHEAGPQLEFEVGTLAPGESRRLELNLRAEKAGLVTNSMTARSDANLETTAACEFEVVAPALEVTVDGPQRRYLERPATYTLSVTNPGTASAKEVQIVTQLSPGLQFVSANNLGEYDASTHSVFWSLAELPPNEQGTVELTALAIEPGEQRLEVASRAQQGLEDRAEARVVVEGLAALSFEVNAIDQMVEVGGETAYEIRVTNQGSKAATNVQVTAIVPGGLRPLGGRGETAHAVEGDRLVFAPVGQLSPKGEARFRVEVQGVRPGDQRLRIEVASDDLREPLAKEEITRVYADE